METTFSIKINALRSTTLGGLSNVIKQVDWTMTGEREGQSFDLPQTTNLPDPQSGGFIQLADLTSDQVVAWVEATDTRLDAIKAHIAMVLPQLISKASFANASMPWAPMPELPNPNPEMADVVPVAH